MNDIAHSGLSIQGGGEAVVLVSGLDGTGKLFYRQVPLLARSYRVATYALRDTATTMEELVDDLGGVVDAVAPETRRATIVGESFGGALALSFALARPAQVQRLVVINSFPYFTPQIRLHLAIFALRALPWGAMGLVRRITASRLHSRHTRLHDIRVPTLFLASERDHLVPSVAQAQYMTARVPGAAMRVLDGHGHICLIAPGVDLARLLDAWHSAVNGFNTSRRSARPRAVRAVRRRSDCRRAQCPARCLRHALPRPAASMCRRFR